MIPQLRERVLYRMAILTGLTLVEFYRYDLIKHLFRSFVAYRSLKARLPRWEWESHS